jgi:hypothetical protein
LGQCGNGEFLILAEDRAAGAEDVSNQGLGARRCVRLH